MFQRSAKTQSKPPESMPHTPANNRRPSTSNRRTPTLQSSITSTTNVSRKKSRHYKLTNEDLEFIKLYSKHFPRAEHCIRPPNHSKRKRKIGSERVDQQSASGGGGTEGRVAVREGQRGHTYELAETLCKLKERPLAAGVQGQMRLIGALRKLDQDRECAWKCWMQCAMRREAQHINNMRLTPIKSRAQNLQDVGPEWYQQLSWEQMETVNKLEMTLYQDIDEGTTNRTRYLLKVLGIEPPPSHRVVKIVMNSSGDDPCKFLIELYKAISTTGRLPGDEDDNDAGEDESGEQREKNKIRTGFEYSLDERLLMSALAHLRVGNVLDRLNQEYGKPNSHLPYFKMVLPPCQKRRKKTDAENTWPYLQPLHIPEYNWLEPKMIQDAIFAQNLYMTMHRVPPPVPTELRPVPYTHIEIPESMKPRRYKSTTQQELRRSASPETKTVMSNTSSRTRLTDESCSRRSYRPSKSAFVTDIISLGTRGSTERTNSRRARWRKRPCRRPSVAAKPRLKVFASWFKKLGQARRNYSSSKASIQEEPRSSTPIANHTLKTALKPRRSTKEECAACDCKEIARRTEHGVGSSCKTSNDSKKRKPLNELEVAGYLPSIPQEPLAHLSNPHELPAIQKWLRMKNGLTYIHPVIALKLYKRSKALWSILDGGRCSMIQSPELCLTRREERSLTWDHHDWLRRESNRVVNEYYRTCFEMQVALAREFYPSMATDYIRNRDKMLKIYFTYLPARPQDCIRMPWKKSEYNQEVLARWKMRHHDTQDKRKETASERRGG